MNTHPRRVLPPEINDLPPFITFCLAVAFLMSALMAIGTAFLVVTAYAWLVHVL